jgi:integrase/recombinase XerC
MSRAQGGQKSPVGATASPKAGSGAAAKTTARKKTVGKQTQASLTEAATPNAQQQAAGGQRKPAPDRAKLFVDAFLAWMEVQKGASPATLKAYGSDLAQLIEFLRGQDADLGRPETVTRRSISSKTDMLPIG